MKKVINKYRNSNGNNPQYSLNYKFDSISSAGKVSGTALELIKKYNELAKEASSNGNYTEMENFRQYAEHYRKIVTDINEKKNMMKSVPENRVSENRAPENKEAENVLEKAETPVNEVKTAENKAEIKAEKQTRKVSLTKKEFKVVEIKQEKPAENSEKSSPESEEKTTKKRVVRKKVKETAEGE